MRSLESDTIERLHFHFSLSCIGEGNGNPLQCSCLEIPEMGEPGGLPSMGSQSQSSRRYLHVLSVQVRPAIKVIIEQIAQERERKI